MTSQVRILFGWIAAFSAVALAFFTLRELIQGDLSTLDLGVRCAAIAAAIIVFAETRKRASNGGGN